MIYLGCDRCGAQRPEPQPTSATVSRLPPGWAYFNAHMNPTDQFEPTLLCGDCCGALRTWLAAKNGGALASK